MGVFMAVSTNKRAVRKERITPPKPKLLLREAKKLRVQKWTWLGPRTNRAHKKRIEDELHRFERFQVGRSPP